MFDNVSIDPLVLDIIATAITALAGVVVAFFVAKFGAKQVKDFWWYVRKYVPDLIKQVDEPTDPANVRIDQFLDQFAPGLYDEYGAALLPVVLRSLADGIDAVLGTPPQSHVTYSRAPAIQDEAIKIQ